jgi:NitT/TauT family transport system substrate-binding protein
VRPVYRIFVNISIIVAAIAVFVLIPAAESASGAFGSGERLTYRLKWLFNMSVVGDLYAHKHKLFAEHGLDVTIKEGGPERDAIRELELGRAQFGVASADQVIRAISRGASVVVIAQIFQINPLQWIYRADIPRIQRLADLRGKTIGITYGGNDETIMKTLLARAGILDDEVRLFSVRYDYTPFYRHKVDIWPVYLNVQGVIINEKLRNAGERVLFFNPAEFGVQFVANSVVTSEQMIKERPDTVQRFTKALLQGWAEALDRANTEKTIETIQQFDRHTPTGILKKQLSATRKLIMPAPGTKIGTINITAWKETEKIMLEQKRIPEPVLVHNRLVDVHGLKVEKVEIGK